MRKKNTSLTTTSVPVPDIDPRMQETSRLYEQSGSELHDPPPNHRIHEPVYYPAYSGPGHAPVFAPSRYAALGAALGTDPRTEFYNKFQGEIEEHDRDFEKKYGGDLDTTLIFVSVRSLAGCGVLRIAWDLILTIRSCSLVYSRP